MIKRISKILCFFENIRSLIGTNFYLPRQPYIKMRLLWCYPKLHLKMNFSGKSQPVSEKILGFTVEAFNRPSLTLLFDEIFISNEYHTPQPGSPQPVIIDAGANIGLATLYFKWRFPFSTVYAFEADPNTFTALEKNITNNKLQNVFAFNCALSDEDKDVSLYVEKGEAGSGRTSILEGRNVHGNVLSVPGKRLSSFLKEKKITSIDLLKMDVEGAEGLVVADLLEHKVLPKIKRLIIEYHHRTGAEKSNLAESLKIFEKNGFEYNINARFMPSSGEGSVQDILIYLYRPA